MKDDKETILNYIDELKQRDRRDNYMTADEVRDAIEHHRGQLQRLGATMEDDVCMILRKLESSLTIRAEIAAQRERLNDLTGDDDF